MDEIECKNCAKNFEIVKEHEMHEFSSVFVTTLRFIKFGVFLYIMFYTFTLPLKPANFGIIMFAGLLFFIIKTITDYMNDFIVESKPTSSVKCCLTTTKTEEKEKEKTD